MCGEIASFPDVYADRTVSAYDRRVIGRLPCFIVGFAEDGRFEIGIDPSVELDGGGLFSSISFPAV